MLESPMGLGDAARQLGKSGLGKPSGSCASCGVIPDQSATTSKGTVGSNALNKSAHGALTYERLRASVHIQVIQESR